MRQDPFLRRTTLALALAGASVNAWCQSAQRIEITGSAEPQAATSALRAPVAVDKTPQSVSVLTRELLDEQGVQTLTEALRNVSAVRGTDARDLFNFGLRIRGFEAGVLVTAWPCPVSSPHPTRWPAWRASRWSKDRPARCMAAARVPAMPASWVAWWR